ncbi:MAG: sugar phosphate isomerase/epimerase [Rhodothermales bacterium]
MIPTWLTDSVTCDLDRALHYTMLWGLEAVELRAVGKHCERVPFVNEARLRRRLEENELPVAAIDPGLFLGPAEDRAGWMNEIASLDDTLAFCTRIGCTRLIVSSFASSPEHAATAADALRRAADRSARAGVDLIVFHEADTCAPHAQALAELLDRVDHPAVRAGWDPASAVMQGDDPADGLPRLANRLGFVRCADALPAKQSWRPASFGEGAVDWGARLRELRDIGYAGPLSLCVQVEPKPKEGLRAATRLHELIRQTAARPSDHLAT